MSSIGLQVRLTGLLDFMMKQENELQKFKLPEAVLCIGGILQVELLGRVQKQEIDGLYYIWSVSHCFEAPSKLGPRDMFCPSFA